MGRTLPDKTAPGQMGRGLGMAHHYRMLGMRNKAPACAGGLCLPKRDVERPNYGIFAQERPSGFLSQLDGSGKCREIGQEQRDAPCGPCRLRHERRAWILVGHFRLELLKPCHSSHQGNITNPHYFFM